MHYCLKQVCNAKLFSSLNSPAAQTQVRVPPARCCHHPLSRQTGRQQPTGVGCQTRWRQLAHLLVRQTACCRRHCYCRQHLLLLVLAASAAWGACLCCQTLLASQRRAVLLLHQTASLLQSALVWTNGQMKITAQRQAVGHCAAAALVPAPNHHVHTSLLHHTICP
jgi:hypothetical protein